jgi:thymidylate kinase
MFIVIEGIDGAGKGRQRIELIEKLRKAKPQTKVVSIEFPDHNGFLYKELIKPVLLEKKSASKYSMFLAFALDQSLFQRDILKAKGSKDLHFICDGYFTTNLVYNCLLNQYFTLKDALGLAKTFGITQPDVSIFVDVEPEICLQRKRSEVGHEMGLDIYERSIEKQKILRSAYKEMIKKKIFGNWLEVNGNGSIDEVSKNIYQELLINKFI